MNSQNALALFQQFPALYRSVRMDPTDPSSPCIEPELFFECGNGWFDLIRRLSFSLSALTALAADDILVVQVKEKYGRLRVYVDGGNEEAQDLIDAAEEESQYICDLCGAAGSLSVTGWRSTRCAAHSCSL